MIFLSPGGCRYNFRVRLDEEDSQDKRSRLIQIIASDIARLRPFRVKKNSAQSLGIIG